MKENKTRAKLVEKQQGDLSLKVYESYIDVYHDILWNQHCSWETNVRVRNVVSSFGLIIHKFGYEHI